jgi:UDP-3-O-[3-hydroxymyristoyl] glucosamine N-acyltransferase
MRLDKSAADLAEQYGLELVGDGAARVSGVASLEDASTSDLSFIRGSKYAKYLSTTKAAVVIVPKEMTIPEALEVGRACLRSEHAYAAFAKVLADYFVETPLLGEISKAAHIHESAEIDPEVNIEAGVWIGARVKVARGVVIQSGSRLAEDVCVGEGSTLCANVVLERRVEVGSGVTLNPGVVIGGDGFGYAQTEKGNLKLPQIGHVVIEDGVEIGANTTVDRASLGVTRIGQGTVIDNLVQIGHGASIGKHCVICSQSGVAGSAVIGDRSILASRSGVGDHLKVAPGTTIGPMAGVAKDIEKPGVYSGFPSMDHGDWLKMVSVMAQLPSLRGALKKLLNNESDKSSEESL